MRYINNKKNNLNNKKADFLSQPQSQLYIYFSPFKNPITTLQSLGHFFVQILELLFMEWRIERNFWVGDPIVLRLSIFFYFIPNWNLEFPKELSLLCSFSSIAE